MAIQLPVVNAAANDTFQIFIDKLNGVINTIANSVITANTNANGATTTGNTYLTGSLGASVLVTTTLRGGNVQAAANLTVASNVTFTGAYLALNGNVTFTNAAITIGANATLTDSLIRFGNSTANSIINSTAIVLGPNATLTGTSLSFGNNTVNAVVNTSGVTLNGAALPLANNKAAVAINGVLVGTATRINFSGSGSANVSATVDAGNSQINVVVSASSSLANGAGGTNTMLLFNDSSAIGGDSGLTYDKTTDILTVANTVLVGTSVVNSTVIAIGNSTINVVANSTTGSFKNGSINTQYAVTGFTIGANVTGNTSQINVGTTAINTTTVATGNVTFTGTLTGGNVTITTSLASIGNSTINVVANSTALVVGGSSGFTINATGYTLGSNLVVNTSFFLVGNSTVSWSGNSTQVQLANSTIAATLQPGALTIGSNVTVGFANVVVGNTYVNSTAISVAALIGGVLGTTTNYFGATAGKVLTTDVLNNAGGYVALTDAASIVVNMATGINFTVTLAGNRTLANPTNTVAGRSGVIQVIQDATGTRTLSFGTSYIFDSDVAPSIGTVANKMNFLFYHVIDATHILITLAAKSV